MRKVCKVTLNKDAFLANCGELLLDSALMNGVDLPHDCRSGVCGACRVRLAEGKVFGGTEAVPEMVSLQGRVVRLDPLASDVVGVSVELQKPLEYLPGQYCKLQFRGFPNAATAQAIRSRVRPIQMCCTSRSGVFRMALFRRRLASASVSVIACG